MPLIKKHQTLLDFATQYEGAADGTAQTAILNGIGITEDMPPATQLQAADIANQRNVANIQQQGLEFATKDNFQIGAGIAFWRIGIDFKIS
jgi:hypothetical protein